MEKTATRLRAQERPANRTRLSGTKARREEDVNPAGPPPAQGPQSRLHLVVDVLGDHTALRQSQELLEQAVELSGLGIFEQNHQEQSFRCSSELREICGWAPEEPVSLAKLIAGVHPEDRERVAAAIRQVQDPSGDGVYALESRFLRLDGSSRWLAVRSRTFFSGAANARQPLWTLGAIADITERKQTEEALRSSEAALRSFFENAPVTCGVVELLDDGDILHVFDNPATAQFFGQPAGSTGGRRATELGATKETISLWRAQYQESARGGKPVRFESYHHKDGRPLWLEATVSAIGSGLTGKPRFCYLAEDITARKEFESELERLVAERTRSLEETTRLLNDFCYSVGHDLKAPIRAQASLAQVLLEKWGEQLGERGRDFAGRIAEAAVQQGKLVDALLAHMSIGRSELPLELVDVGQVLQLALADLQAEITQRQAVVEVDLRQIQVLANPASLRLVLFHLLSNALKFVARQIRPEVKVWAEPRPGSIVRLWVQDNGIGIPMEYSAQLFGVFHRLQSNAEYLGTGIGLAVVKRAVERMGGRVGVEAGARQGSRFWFELGGGA